MAARRKRASYYTSQIELDAFRFSIQLFLFSYLDLRKDKVNNGIGLGIAVLRPHKKKTVNVDNFRP